MILICDVNKSFIKLYTYDVSLLIQLVCLVSCVFIFCYDNDNIYKPFQGDFHRFFIKIIEKVKNSFK